MRRLPCFEDFMDATVGNMVQVHNDLPVWGRKFKKGMKITDIKDPLNKSADTTLEVKSYNITDAAKGYVVVEDSQYAYLITLESYREIRSRL